MKTLKAIILSVGATAVLGASGLYAQNNATVEIPFEFTVRNTTLPAGEYTMQRMSATSGTMVDPECRNLQGDLRARAQQRDRT
jgi:hypothetical protein